MKRKSFIFSVLILLLGLWASAAMACNCGKKAGGNNQDLSCSCGATCGGEKSACSDGNMKLAQAMGGQEIKESEPITIEVGNKICPVSGEKVGGEMGDVVPYEYNGKIYNLCCKACAKDFKKDPEKYSKVAEDEVANSAVLENEEGQEADTGSEQK